MPTDTFPVSVLHTQKSVCNVYTQKNAQPTKGYIYFHRTKTNRSWREAPICIVCQILISKLQSSKLKLYYETRYPFLNIVILLIFHILTTQWKVPNS